MKVTERCATQGERTLFICDFSPLKSPAADQHVADASLLDADFICVAYNPGKAVRVDSAALASTIKREAGKDVIFNLATRDMNKLALGSHLLGAQMLGLENLLVVQGDPFRAKELALLKDVSDYRPTELVRAIRTMNEGVDYKGLRLKHPTDFCVGASVDLSRGTRREAWLTHKKVVAGAEFFLVQPVFDPAEISAFLAAYEETAGSPLAQPLFVGLQVLVKGGVIFSNVPEAVRDEIEQGRSGTEIALELLAKFQSQGLNRVYLVAPILKGGARDYPAAQAVLAGAGTD